MASNRTPTGGKRRPARRARIGPHRVPPKPVTWQKIRYSGTLA
jgi:hypothetical protein